MTVIANCDATIFKVWNKFATAETSSADASCCYVLC